MKFELYTQVALNTEVPKYLLQKGDVVTLVEFLEGNESLPNAYICEIFNAVGDTIGVCTVAENQLTPLSKNEILHTRLLDAA
ncbi:MAG: DUF4926 domain-containing protein [Runella slithyformis]|jgi:hypothetical protein|nr:MAG: DUF4926 domain-containing protein [Runella slithyformis]TAF44343.1 MAG: DUF4926 domain-containing protein [Runella slithyformis]TAF80738.1 MAG: DUF4926 domain-containing protein [Runella slithyformis]